MYLEPGSTPDTHAGTTERTFSTRARATSCIRIEKDRIPTSEVRHVGELTRKGTDTDSWWALRDDDGTVYRLQPSSDEMAKTFFLWQYRRVMIVGVPDGKVLSVNVICVREASLVESPPQHRAPAGSVTPPK